MGGPEIESRQYCGRVFQPEEVDWIRRLIVAETGVSRQQISRRFCEHFNWRKPDGGLKEMSCRVALLRMARDGVIHLPAARNPRGQPYISRNPQCRPRPEVHRKAGEFDLRLEPVDKGRSALWNEYIDRYHYLGYTPLAGAQLRYFVESQEGTVALLAFSAAAWATGARDAHIGWDAELRKKNLRYVVNNSRFLILPWIHSKGLASRILALAARLLPSDWEQKYGYRPALLETFVERDRFRGTCYKAAGWVCVGETTGRGKLDVRHDHKSPIKTVWLLPLQKDFRGRLTGGGA